MGRVVVRFHSRALDKRVASVEELAYVATVVLFESKLSAGMKFLKAFHI